MLSVPTSDRLVAPGTPTEPLTFDPAALYAVTDPWQRARLADELADQLRQLSAVVFDVRRAAVRELVEERQARRSQVARHLGKSAARICQLLRRPQGVAA